MRVPLCFRRGPQISFGRVPEQFPIQSGVRLPARQQHPICPIKYLKAREIMVAGLSSLLLAANTESRPVDRHRENDNH